MNAGGMKVLQINSTDLQGRVYNGHDLQISLNQEGIHTTHLVMKKNGYEPTTVQLCNQQELFTREKLIALEQKTGMLNLLEPYGAKIVNTQAFQEADLVHYQLFHCNVLSPSEFSQVSRLKPSIWTIHDLWAVSGHCVYPLTCQKWKTGCSDCPKLKDPFFPLAIDKANELWKIKKEAYKYMDIDIVVASDYTKKYIEESPLTRHFKRIHKIPFGISLEKYKEPDKYECKTRLGINPNSIVIACRTENNEIKGVQYFVEALERLPVDKNIVILTVGGGKLPASVTERFKTLELGWQQEEGMLQFFGAADIFVMPSLAETFGLMAIEAMASKCTVIVFEGTVLPEVTYSPECGIAVPYMDGRALSNAIIHLINNEMERTKRGSIGRKIVEQYYTYSEYVRKHKELYQEVYKKNQADISKRNYSIAKVKEEQENSQKRMGTQLDIIYEFQNNLMKRFDNIDKLCIFCAGRYGQSTFQTLKSRLVKVNYYVDNDPGKWGYGLDGTECVGMEQLFKDREHTLIIVANKTPDIIVEDLRKRGFQYIMTKQELDVLLEGVPLYEDISGFKEIAELDYSSEGVQLLLKKFNQVIYDLSQYFSLDDYRSK